jgi:hypothetical protein
VSLGEFVVVGWTGGGGQVLAGDLDNEAGGGVACWPNGTRRLAAVEALMHGMIHTGM